jgi:hypothetical protein
VLHAATERTGLKLGLTHCLVGWKAREQEGTLLSAATEQTLRASDGWIMGPTFAGEYPKDDHTNGHPSGYPAPVAGGGRGCMLSLFVVWDAAAVAFRVSAGFGAACSALFPVGRSIVDRVVGTPERLVFEGAPILDPPLAQALLRPADFQLLGSCVRGGLTLINCPDRVGAVGRGRRRSPAGRAGSRSAS